MVMEGHNGLRASDIDKFTSLGAEQLQNGHIDKAKESFEIAYRKAKHLDDGFTERACAFNLGAAYIALTQPEKGLELLQRAVPPLNQRDGKSNGDLFYNFGLGYGMLKTEADAVRYYELALEEYQFERDNPSMEADVATKIGEIYSRCGQWLPAARSFQAAAEAHGKLQDHDSRALCLCEETAMLLHAGKQEEAVAAADDCMILCQHVTNHQLIGKLYNELGLKYTQCGEYYKSATCFEMALPLTRAPHSDKRREAVILQNLGAVYNSLGDYQRAVPYHEQSAALHVELGSRNSQGQCFLNLAFAHSQLGDNDSAGECYLHALQAAKDTEDKKGQWQALEGLGAVSFNNEQVTRAVNYFKAALSTLAASGETLPLAQERIVGKLTDALQFQFNKGGSGHDERNLKAPSEDSIAESQVDVPASKGRKGNQSLQLIIRQQQQEQQQHQQRPQSPRKYRLNPKLNSEFDHIATGLGTYDSLSDASLLPEREKRRMRRTYQRSKSRQSQSSVGHDTVDQQTQQTQGTRPNLARRKSAPRRAVAEGRMAPEAVRKRQQQPLLRAESFDSEDEHRQFMRLKRRGTSSLADSEVEYRQRLEPPGTAEADSESFKTRQQERKRNKQGDNEILDILKRLTKAVAQKEKDEDDDDLSDGEVKRETKKNRPKSSVAPRQSERPQSHMEEKEYDDAKKLREAYAEQLDDETGDSEEEEEEEQEEEEEEEEEEEGEDNVGYETDTGEEEEESGEEEDEERQHAPPLPTASPPPLSGTYEKPVPTPEVQENHSNNPPANYFRSDSPLREKRNAGNEVSGTMKVSMPMPGTGEGEEPLYQTIRTIRPDQQHEQKAGPSRTEEAGPNNRQTDGAEPNSKNTEEAGPDTKQTEEAGPSREWEEPAPPPLPARRGMSRAEDGNAESSSESESSSVTDDTESEDDDDTDTDSPQNTHKGEEFLNKVRLDHERNRAEREQASVQLPSKAETKTSKMCVVM